MAVPLKQAFKQLGQHVARQQDSAAHRPALVATARKEFLAQLEARPRKRLAAPSSKPSGWLQHAGFAMTGAAAAVVVIALWSVMHRPLTFRVDESSRATSGGGLQAPSTRSLPVAFSDGSSLTLEAGALAKVMTLRETGADVLVQNGVVRADIVHSADTSWTLMVGPYLVRITGTRFETGWNVQERRFFVRVTEGSVVVSGCSLAAQPVDAGSEVSATCLERPVAPSNDAKDSTPQVPAPPTIDSAPRKMPPVTSSPTVAAAESPAPEAPPVVPQASSSVAPPDWVQLASNKRYAEAMQLVGTRFDAECQTASASELLLLADAARFGGQASKATAALLALRTRFPSDPLAGVAAFHLGRMALGSGRSAEGTQWLQTALREQPSGPLAREAMGRLLEVYAGSGQVDQARQLAATYLASYPNGPHAALARSLLED